MICEWPFGFGHTRATTVLIRDQADRHAIAQELLRYGDDNGDQWADLIDTLSMHPMRGVRSCGNSRRSPPQTEGPGSGSKRGSTRRGTNLKVDGRGSGGPADA